MSPSPERGARSGSGPRGRRLVAPEHPSRRSTDVPGADHHHRNVQGGGARAAVFGMQDGLLTNVALVLGSAGANPGPGVVRLVGVLGLVAGAFSMGAGEYTSMQFQRELLQRELDLERHEIDHRPEGERRELIHIYERRGVDPTVASELASEMMRTPELALETHAREELGIDPAALGSPVQASVASFVSFAVGALVPLVPWFFSRGVGATVASVALGAAAALALGAARGVVARQPWVRSALRQLAMSAVVAAVLYGVGAGVGTGAGLR
ncbi:MAG TPA: VIT1/CCC1 transporter family protein [Acidimicrobiales bacterium]|nr:VIT1/CCC1 transporter family protein [Acidimicrobiales bacterium]